MDLERTYKGESLGGNLQEALDAALRQLSDDLAAGGVRDGSASWVVAEIAGELGGIAGFHSVKATITAKRSGGWT